MESQGRPGVSRHRSRRRTGLCLFNLHQRSPGIRDPDRSGGNEAAGVCEGRRPGDHRQQRKVPGLAGEGRLDGQTVMGKAPVGVARIAKEFHKPVLAFSGSVTREAAACNDAGIDAFFPILRSVVTLEEAMDPENARKNMADTAEQIFRLIQAVQPMQAV